MPYINISHRDGEFDIVPMSDESADHLSQQGGDPIYVEDSVYEAWVAHKKQHDAFNALWRTTLNLAQLRGVYFNCPSCKCIIRNQSYPIPVEKKR